MKWYETLVKWYTRNVPIINKFMKYLNENIISRKCNYYTIMWLIWSCLEKEMFALMSGSYISSLLLLFLFIYFVHSWMKISRHNHF